MKAHRAELDMSKLNVTEDLQKLLAKEQSAIMYPGIATSFHKYWPWLGNAGWFRLLGSVGPASPLAAPVDTLMHIWYDRSTDNRPG
jgi:hypothetical protein